MHLIKSKIRVLSPKKVANVNATICYDLVFFLADVPVPVNATLQCNFVYDDCWTGLAVTRVTHNIVSHPPDNIYKVQQVRVAIFDLTGLSGYFGTMHSCAAHFIVEE